VTAAAAVLPRPGVAARPDNQHSRLAGQGLPASRRDPCPRSAGQDRGQFPKPGPQVPDPSGHVHRGEAFHLAAVLQLAHQVDSGATAQGPQRLLVTGREVSQPGYHGGEGAEFVAPRPDPGRLDPARLADGQAAELVAPVSVATRPGEPHRGDRAEPDGGRALQAGCSVVVRTRSSRRPNGSRASTLASAWASAEPNISPGGPSRSFTRLRAEQMISPPAVEAHAPTAMFPVRSASHAGGTPPARACPAPPRSGPQRPGRPAENPPHESRRPPAPGNQTGSRP
jgi:hypothetical protein